MKCICISLPAAYFFSSRPTAVNLGDAAGKLKEVASTAAQAPEATAHSVAQVCNGCKLHKNYLCTGDLLFSF